MDPTRLPYPVESAPRPGQDPVPLLLYCPDEGRWLLGLWSEDAWRLQGHEERVLHPTHWLPMSTDVVVERETSSTVPRPRVWVQPRNS